ncbi:hypothetical protein BG004_002463 [Podila humilis]|nr:hypothetical protein BG004_002463 [Podila humilis]
MTTVEDIRAQLQHLGLDSRGNKSTIKDRLRKHLKKVKTNKPNFDTTTTTTTSTHLEESENDRSGDGSEGIIDFNENTVLVTGRKKKSQARSTAAVTQEDHDTFYSARGWYTDDDSRALMIAKNSRYDYFLAFDVEATCESGFTFEFPNEVIEFPVVLLDGKTLEVETVDQAPTFVEVLEQFEEWLKKHGIILGEYSPISGHGCHHDSGDFPAFASASSPTTTKKKNHHTRFRKGKGGNLQLTQPDFEYCASFCFVTDGPFDIRDFIAKQCLHSKIPRPSYFTKQYLDLRTLFKDYFDLTHWLNLEGMLNFLGETFVGRQHSGICDARMVGLILKRLARGFIDTGNEDSIFQLANMGLVATQWSASKIVKFAGGCVLKTNRQIDQTKMVKMWSFDKIKRREALPSMQAIATSRGVGTGEESSEQKIKATPEGTETDQISSDSSHSDPLLVAES